VVDRLKDAVQQRGMPAAFVTDKQVPADLILLINGCKHACLDEAYVSQGQGPPILSVRGEMVGDMYVKEEDIPDFLVERIAQALR